MDIDLLFTDTGTAGLIANTNFVKKIVGVLLDLQTGLASIEFTDMDSLDLNISIDPDFFGLLDRVQILHIGAVKDGNIAQAYQVPLMFLDDPYRGESLKQPPEQARNPLVAFERFIKLCTNGQPVHREDLGDEDNSACVLGDAMPSSLQFAPHLARRRALEAAPNTPNIAPRGPAGPGLGGSSGGGGSAYRTPPHGNPDDERG